jgi:6-phosphogluconate dehydrogenase
MEIGFVGLGRMGMNMVTRLVQGGHRVVATTRDPEKVRQATEIGAEGVASPEEVIRGLERPRTIWIMVPAGRATQATIDTLLPHLDPEDLVVDGGNSFYRDSVRRHGELRGEGIRFIDAGTSGGIWGLEVGYCLMVGGRQDDVKRLEPALETLAPVDGYLHVGPPGAGHFVKMVHNGIEYGMLQAYGEGFEILQKSSFPIDLGKVSHLWNQGSVVRSWLLELAERAFAKDPELSGIRGHVEDSGEGRWTVKEAIDLDVPAPVITDALLARFRSRQEESFGAQVIAALRAEFGGHAVKRSEP